MRIRYLGIVLVLLALVLPASPVHASGVVTVCDEAHLLTALEGGGTVTFACSGTIYLSATIAITTDTDIDGSGQDVTISGGNNVTVMDLYLGVALRLKRMTIADGNSDITGGGISNEFGELTVEQSSFVGNVGFYGNAIFNSGTLTVSESSFVGNCCSVSAGGIYNAGIAHVDRSTFFDNYAYEAGAIANTGAITISNSTIFDNGSISAAAIVVRGGVATIINSTVADNWFIAYGGPGNILNHEPGKLILRNTIASNYLNPTLGNCGGIITDGGGNLSYPDASCPGINADPVLGPLQTNGGPTWTMALGPGSAAIDAGNDATCAAAPVNNLDQRGVVRPQGAHCDIGAFEWVCPSFVPPAQVGVEDIVAIASLWGWTDVTPGWDPQFDLNLDSRIDILDIMLVTAAWGYTCS